MNTYVNLSQLNEVVEKTAQAMEEGKNEIFDISEKARVDCKTLEQELVEISRKIQVVIDLVDELEIKEKASRVKLVNVSRNFNDYTEDDIKKAYDVARDLQVQLSLKRQEEKELFKERSRLEIRLKDSIVVLRKAESLTSKVGMALDLLRSSFSDKIDDLRHKQDMGLRIIEAQEAERKRVSRDIHDGPAQAMANVVLKAEYCERIIDTNPEEVRTELVTLKEVVRDSLRNIRKIIYDLMPMSLADLGLVPTLEKLVRDIETETATAIEFKFEQKGNSAINQMIELTVFRIVQEGLTNVRKHARAKSVRIHLLYTDTEVELRFEDDGVGFEPAKIRDNRNSEGGYGLYSMQERVDLLKGSIVLDSTPNKGTRIHVIIPLVDEEA